jgi:glycogen operon protein
MSATSPEGPRFGALPTKIGIRFAVWSGAASRVWVSVFDNEGKRELDRLELDAEDDGVFALHVSRLKPGTRYGFRADGDYAPERGLWFDPEKLLVDPYAVELDRPFVYDARLAAPRGESKDTAPLVPKAIAMELPDPLSPVPPLFEPGGFIYEVPVKAFSMLHPRIPKRRRGTIGALAHPAVIEHLWKLQVSAVELMPVTAWIDERHLPPLGLSNGWGYNPVTFMALDPRLAPGGLAELRETVSALHAAGIGVILDVVFNHTGESDRHGPTLSLRGLDGRSYYRHFPGSPVRLVNDTGTGNTLACNRAIVQELVLDTLRHFVVNAGVDGFRFDLAPVLGRIRRDFDPDAPLFSAIRNDPVLADRVMIAEPWDVGPDGYQLGNFPGNFLEWNDRYRDDVRRFWRGDRNTLGQLATRLAGSSDVFQRGGQSATRSVNFIAAHDGFTLADLTRYERKHNEANGEHNRDGHDENFSWNGGVEGETRDPKVTARRQRDMRALLATLFASRGTIMLTAGDEFGRSQMGNNNAYAQDNKITWLDWAGRDLELEEFVVALAGLRGALLRLRDVDLLTGESLPGSSVADVQWRSERGGPLADAEWEEPERRRVTMLLGEGNPEGGRLAVMINGDRRATAFALPLSDGFAWEAAVEELRTTASGHFMVAGRSVGFALERRIAADRAGMRATRKKAR